ncbi:exodeoxyribonuclease III [Streptomyces cinnamoneus]|uniref:exodeoxyribonuclease III n=1 Tax=Streptomyces cinnamoneus TaxID=53446 RepID=UPI00267FDE33
MRAEPHQLPDEVREPEGWHVVHAPAAAKGRAGVSLYSRREPDAVRIGFGSAEFDGSGRYAEIDLPGVTVASLYLPSGEVGTERQDEKERFMAEFLPYLVGLKARAAAEGREVLVCGDWNIAHTEADLKNWKANRKSAGFLPEEREWLSKVFEEYTDVVRASTRASRARTPGGPTAGAPSTTTRAGASTTSPPRRAWPAGPSRPTWSAPPRTPSAGATTRP